MIKYLCNVENCGKEAKSLDSEKDWTGQEMFTMNLKGYSYFWARVGFANITLCSEHRKECMEVLCRFIKEKYNF